jgi:predicted PurR-regulated permease PerM
LLSAVVQGILAGFGYFFAGLDSVFLLTMLTMLFALIPFVGATAVWLPCALWLFLFEDRTAAAVALAVYGALVVSMADNVIKPLVLQGRSNMHPLLALLSVLGGVKAMGPIGIVVGPMVVAFLQPLLVMLQTELKTLGKAEAGKAEG